MYNNACMFMVLTYVAIFIYTYNVLFILCIECIFKKNLMKYDFLIIKIFILKINFIFTCAIIS